MSSRYQRRRPKVVRLSPEEERTAALAALDAAAAATRDALAAVEVAWTDAGERRAQRRWDVAHEAQNAAARRLHAANEALGRQPRDTAP